MDRSTRRKYLLGRLPAAEGERLDELLFASDDFFNEMDREAAELVEDYLSGGLPPEFRHDFEQRFFGTAAGRCQIHLARWLRSQFDGRAAGPRSSRRGP